VQHIPPEIEEEELEEELEPAAVEEQDEEEYVEEVEQELELAEPVDVDDEPIEEADYDFADEEPAEEEADYTFADETDDYLYLDREGELELAEVVEEDTQVEPLDLVETEPDEEYRLGPPVEHAPYSMLDAGEEDDEEYKLAAPESEKPAEPKRLTFQNRPKPQPQRPKKADPPARGGFTWESPEMWWRERPGDAA
jgi:hypothetical protein